MQQQQPPIYSNFNQYWFITIPTTTFSQWKQNYHHKLNHPKKQTIPTKKPPNIFTPFNFQPGQSKNANILRPSSNNNNNNNTNPLQYISLQPLPTPMNPNTITHMPTNNMNIDTPNVPILKPQNPNILLSNASQPKQPNTNVNNNNNANVINVDASIIENAKTDNEYALLVKQLSILPAPQHSTPYSILNHIPKSPNVLKLFLPPKIFVNSGSNFIKLVDFNKIKPPFGININYINSLNTIISNYNLNDLIAGQLIWNAYYSKLNTLVTNQFTNNYVPKYTDIVTILLIKISQKIHAPRLPNMIYKWKLNTNESYVIII